MEDFKYSGSWWLPNTKRQVSGDLTFSSQEGIQLHLLDTIGEYSSTFEKIRDESSKEYPIILGMVTDCTLITLCDCQEIGTNVCFKKIGAKESLSYNTARYDAKAAFIGTHFFDLKELRFHRARVRYDYLPDFVRLQGFTNDFATRDGKFERYTCTYELPPKIIANTSKGTISASCSLNKNGEPIVKGLVLRQFTWLEIELKEGLALKELDIRYVQPLQYLISLATDKPNSVTGLFVYSKDRVETVPNNLSMETPIQVVFQQRERKERQDTLLSRSDLIFTLQDQGMSERFGGIIERWLNITHVDELGDVCNLFFSVLYAPDLNLVNQFLNIAFATELYHRKRFRDKSDFKDRIEEVVEATSEVVSPLFSDRDYFVNKVKDTRHYRVHNAPDLKKKAAKDEELYWMTKLLSYMVQTCLLKELGLSSQECFELFSKNRDYQFALKRAPTWRKTKNSTG